jgi:hypothetical protein
MDCAGGCVVDWDMGARGPDRTCPGRMPPAGAVGIGLAAGGDGLKDAAGAGLWGALLVGATTGEAELGATGAAAGAGVTAGTGGGAEAAGRTPPSGGCTGRASGGRSDVR